MITLHDEQLVRQLEAMARQENRSVEDVIKSMVEQRSAVPTETKDSDEAVRRARRSIYKLAREYWQEEGDAAKLALTDEELDEQFGAFDEEGIPRLKSELKSLEPPPGSLAYAAKIFEEADFHSGQPDWAARSEDILKEHFAEDLLNRMRERNATE